MDLHHSNFRPCIAVVALLIITTSCGDSFMKSSPRSKTSALLDLTSTVDAAGNVSASFDPSSKSVQVLRLSSGPLAGSGIAIPPGALSISSSFSVTMGSGENLANSSFIQELGIAGNSASASGASVSFIPSENVQASAPFTLSIPLSSTALRLSGSSQKNLAVFYRAIKVTNNVVSYQIGVIPKNALIIGNNKVSFATTSFGVFQVAETASPVEETKAISAVPPTLKANAQFPLAGNWGSCTEVTVSSNDSSSGGSSSSSSFDWSAGNSYTIPAGSCSAMIGFSLKINVTDSSPYTIGISINGATPTTDNVITVTSNSNTDYPSSLWHLYGGVPSNYNITFWAPTGCVFRSTSTNTDYYYVTVGSSNISGPASCYINADNSIDKLHCDGSSSSSNSGYAGGPSSGSGNSNNGSSSSNYGIKFGGIAGKKYYKEEKALITKSSFTYIKKIFEGEKCTGDLITQEAETGNMSLPDGDQSVTQATGEMGFKINLGVQTKKGTIYTDSAVSAANASPNNNGCGFTNWVRGESKDLLNNSYCDGGSSSHYTRFYQKDNYLYLCDSLYSHQYAGDSDSTRIPSCSGYTSADRFEKIVD